MLYFVLAAESLYMVLGDRALDKDAQIRIFGAKYGMLLWETGSPDQPRLIWSC